MEGRRCKKVELQTTVEVSTLHNSFINLCCTAFFLNFLPAFLKQKSLTDSHQVLYFTRAYWAPQYMPDTKRGAKRIQRLRQSLHSSSSQSKKLQISGQFWYSVINIIWTIATSLFLKVGGIIPNYMPENSLEEEIPLIIKWSLRHFWEV